MNWAAPLLGLLALPLAAAIVALYLLRMKRKDLVVPASFLWPERQDEVRANSLFQKLRFSWLLVLQLAALALVAFAIAQPQMRQTGLAGRVAAIVLDASATMKATDAAGGASRFDAGLNQVRQIISSAGPGDRLALIWAGPTPRVVFPLTSDPARQRAAMGGLAATDAPSDAGEALRLAAALVGTTEGAQILLLSDGRFPEVASFSPGKASVDYRRLGQSGENLSIEALSAGEQASSGLVFVSVRNHGTKPRKTTVTLTADGRVIDSASPEIEPGKAWSKTMDRPAGSKVLEARLEGGDSAPADNYAAASANPGATTRVLLVGKDNLFLERALALEPRLIVDKAEEVPSSQLAGTEGASSYDVVVFDGVEAEPVKARGVLVFGKTSPAASSSGSIQRPVWESSSPHPALKSVDLAGVYFDSAAKLAPRGGGRAIAESSQGPLIIAADSGQRVVHAGFTILNSDFPLSVGFPIFLANSIEWLAGGLGKGPVVIETGGSLALPVADGSVAVKGPNGFSQEFRSRDGRTIVRDLPDSGKYTASWAGGEQIIYASLKDRDESDITPRAGLSLGGKVVEGQQAVSRLADIWRPLALLAVLVLAFEWWFFARRS